MDQDEFNLTVAQSLGRIENKIDSFVGDNGPLAVVQGRVEALESDRTRNWWFTVVFAPIIAASQATLRHFGINV